jgi:cysteine desulfurase family protein (TIGR01976 family)
VLRQDPKEPAVEFDVRSVRKHFPALADGVAHFDGPGGSQVPDVVGEAVGSALTSAISNRGRMTAAERRADDIVRAFRRAAADLLGADPGGIVFGRSMTQLTYDFARTLAKAWAPADEVIVTRLDHDANIRPWVQAAAAAGAVVRWADFDPGTGELSPDEVARALSPRTRLVAVTGASNLIGTRPAVAEISRLAHETGAVCYVDGVHLTPHAPVDMTALGADLYVCSPYKFLGPHCGVLAGRPELLAGLHPDKLLPATDEVPERFEFGTLPYELLAGTTAAVDFLAGTAGDSAGADSPGGAAAPRRDRIVAALTALEQYEDALRRDLEARLLELDGVTMFSRAEHRTPTLLFAIRGKSSGRVAEYLAALGVDAPAGSFYALEASRRLGLGDDGAVRAGLAPYTDQSDADRLVDGVRRAIRQA